MRKIFLLLCACAFALNSWAAADVIFGGIHYQIIDYTTEESANLEVIADNSYKAENFTAAVISEPFKVGDITYTVTSIDESAFDGCSNITQITIPNTVTTIKRRAFSGCDGLTSVSFPSSVQTIGDESFNGCDNLEEIVIQSPVISIGQNSFSVCPKLATVVIQATDICFGDNTFYNCTALETVTFPNHITNILCGGNVFNNCPFEKTTNVDDYRYLELDGNPYCVLVSVPSNITSLDINSNCKAIGGSACRLKNSLITVSIPAGVTSIGDYAFNSCSKLTTVTIAGTVRTIGKQAFARCGNLTTLNILDGVESIGKGVGSIGKEAFYYCENLTSVVIPGSVKDIGQSAFCYCYGITSVTFSEGVENIDYDSFGGCKLTSIVIPNSIKKLEVRSFWGFPDDKLNSVTLPRNIEEVGNSYPYPFGDATIDLMLTEAESISDCNWWNVLGRYFSGNCTCVWNYKNKTVTAITDGDEGGGTVTIEGGQTHAYGSQVKLTAAPNEGFKFVGWSDGNHELERVITVQDNEAEGNADVNTYTAFFYDINQPTYDIVVTTKGKGTTTGGGIYLPNAQVTLTATPTNAEIYHFVGWSNGTEIIDNKDTISFTATENVNLTAIFEGQTVEIGDNTVKARGRMTDNCVFRPTISGFYTISSSFTNYYDDAYGYLLDSEGNVLAEDDNGGNSRNFQFQYNLEAGNTYYIGAGFANTETSGDVPLNISEPVIEILTATDGNGRVIGGGIFAYNSTKQLEAVPNTGYHFVRWTDDGEGNTDNPRTITITGNTTYKATFAINEYDITIADYTNGTIEGAGKYNHGQTVTLTANPSTGYHFVDWGEGTTDETTITFSATKDTAFSPSFAINTYTLTATGANGSFEGIEQSYNHGATASITAKPDEGFEFASWRDGKTDNPLDTVITSDVALEAIFVVEGHTLYTITITEPQNGTVKGGGVYEEDSIATLTATPAEGYHFVKWSDNVANITREIVVKGDTTLAAVFEINKYTVSVAAAENGTCSGAKTYNHGDNVKIVATPDNGYHFAAWSTGETADTLKFVATKDTAFTPSFEINRYRVSGVAENGSISGLRTYNHGSEANLSAYPETGYHFVKWADGETSFNRSLTVTCDTSFKALFEINTYKATVIESEHGTVSGAGEYTHGQTASFTATPAEGYQFLFWSDGGTVNPRSIKMTQDVDVRAVFSLEGHSAFNVSAGAGDNGTVTGGGLYIEGETATLTAKPSSEAYHFVEWNDGNKDNPRNVVVDKALNFTATFAINTYTVKASTHKDEAERGTVTGGGTYTYGSMATLRATPAEGYRFTSWSDDDVYNIKFIEVKEDMTFTAHFAPAVGVDYVYVDVHDTLVVTDTLTVQEILKEYVRDTITVEKVVEKIVRDTVTIEGTGNDTVYVRENVYTNDTIYVAVHDTVTVVDSAIRTVVDMLLEMVHDTVYAQSVIDSLVETLVIHDTIYITKTDTIYITKTDTVYLQTSARQASAVNMNVYPNPTSSFVTVNADSEFSFILTNASGKVLRKDENEQSYMLDLSEYPAGIYMLTTSDGVTHKIVKK